MIPFASDGRSEAEILRDLLARAEAAFADAPSDAAWAGARTPRIEEARALLAKPIDDPGLMLARIWARFVALLLERLNRAPTKQVAAFYDALGMHPLPPVPAAAQLQFVLKPRTGAVRLPAGIEVSAPGPNGARVFATRDPLTVLPSTLLELRTIDPLRDSEGDRLSEADFPALAGERPLRHALHVGWRNLLEASDTLRVALLLSEAPGGPPLDAVIARFRGVGNAGDPPLRLRYDAPSGPADAVMVVDDAGGFGLLRGPGLVRAELDPPSVPRALSGAGLATPLEGRWLRAELPRSFPDAAARTSLRFVVDRLFAGAADLLPAVALAAGAPVDPASAFRPFGDEPARGVSLALCLPEALSKPLARLALEVEVAEPELVWEALVRGRFTPILEDRPHAGDRPEAFLLADDNAKRVTIKLVAGAELERQTIGAYRAFWFRARITAGRYRSPPRIADIEPEELTTTVHAASSVIVGNTRITSVILNAPLAFPGLTAFAFDDSRGAVDLALGLPMAGDLRAWQLLPGDGRAYEPGTPVRLRGLDEVAQLSQPLREAGLRTILVRLRKTIIPGGQYVLLGPDTGRAETPPAHDFITVASADIKDGTAILALTQALTSAYPNGAVLSQVVAPLVFLTPTGEVAAEGQLQPLGDGAEPGRTFHVGILTPTPPEAGRLLLSYEIRPEPVTAGLAFEYLAPNGWRTVQAEDGTRAFTRTGAVVLELPGLDGGQVADGAELFPGIAEAEVGGKRGFWLRARLARGSYGRLLTFVFVRAREPASGLKVLEGTGDLIPPEIDRLRVSYIAHAAPDLVAENGFLLLRLRSGEPIAPLLPVEALPEPHADPVPGLYLGLDALPAGEVASLYVALTPEGPPTRPSRGNRLVGLERVAAPTVGFFYHGRAGWAELAVIDATQGLTRSGTISFLVPDDMQPLARFSTDRRLWLRITASSSDGFDARRLAGVFLNGVAAEEGLLVRDEPVGSGTGLADQRLRLAKAPVFRIDELAVLEAEMPPPDQAARVGAQEGEDAIRPVVTGSGERFRIRWHRVTSFAASSSTDRHYILDEASGRLRFGDGVAGLPLPRGSGNVVATYRAGTGAVGGPPRGGIAKLAVAVPGIASATNPLDSTPAATAETNAEAVARAPRAIRHRALAVTAADLADLAREIGGKALARLEVLPNLDRALRFRPGWVTAVALPQSDLPRPLPDPLLLERLRRGLDGLLPPGRADRINLIGPAYVAVEVEATVIPRQLMEVVAVRQEVETRLRAFLHPLTGGPDCTGWPMGRDVPVSEVCEAIEATRGVDHAEAVRLATDRLQLRVAIGNDATRLLPAGTILASSDARTRLRATRAILPGPGSAWLEGFRAGELAAFVQELEVVDVSRDDLAAVVVAVSLDLHPLLRRGAQLTSADGLASAMLEELPEVLPGRTARVGLAVPPAFAAQVRVGSRIGVGHPLPLRIAGVRVDARGSASIDVEPFALDITLPADVLLASLDSQVRLPLAGPLAAETGLSSLPVILPRAGDMLSAAEVTVELLAVGPERETVFVDAIALPSCGALRIRMAQAGGGRGA
jgi:hypothetical protein